MGFRSMDGAMGYGLMGLWAMGTCLPSTQNVLKCMYCTVDDILYSEAGMVGCRVCGRALLIQTPSKSGLAA